MLRMSWGVYAPDNPDFLILNYIQMKICIRILLFMAVLALFVGCEKEAVEQRTDHPVFEELVAAQAALTAQEQLFFEWDYATSNLLRLKDGIIQRTANDSLVNVIRQAILFQNAEQRFIPDLIDRVGYPVWNRSRAYNSTNGVHELVATPFAKLESDTTNAILFALLESGQNPFFVFVDREILKNEWVALSQQSQGIANAAIVLFSEFDQNLFNTFDPVLLEWILLLIDQDGLDGGVNLTIRDICVAEFEVVTCNGPYAIAPPSGSEFETRNCGEDQIEVVTITYVFFNCSGVGSSADGSNSPFSSGNSWGSSGSNNGSSSNNNSGGGDAFIQQCEDLADYFSGDIPWDTGDPFPLTVEEIGVCEDILLIQSSLFISRNDLIWLVGNQDLLSKVAFSLRSGLSATGLAALSEYIKRSRKGQTTLNLREFTGHYTRVQRLVTQLKLPFAEEEWLLNNEGEAETIDAFLNTHPDDAFASTAAAIITGMKQQGHLGSSVQNIPGYAFNTFVQDRFPDEWETEQATLNGSIWWSIIMAEAEANGGSLSAYLEAGRLVLDQGWFVILKPVAAQLSAYAANNLGVALPSTQDEWYVLASVMGPTIITLGIDLGTDLLPIVGDAKAFANAFIAAKNENYGEATLEFIGGVLGIIPVGKLLSKVPELIDAGKIALKGYRVVRGLLSFSNIVFSKLKSFIEFGWKGTWDTGSNKLIIKNSTDDVMAEFIDQHPNLPTIKIKSPAARQLIDIANLKNLDDVSINPGGQTSLASQVTESPLNHIKYKPDEDGMIDDINDILSNGDPTGYNTEKLARKYFESGNGNFTWKDGKYNASNNGFDNVYVNETTGEVIIDECKQWPPVLSGPNPGTGLPSQMSDVWVSQHVIPNLANSSDQAKQLLAQQVQFAFDNGLLTKTVTSIKKCTSCSDRGNIFTIKVK
jgi:hypothetical protein